MDLLPCASHYAQVVCLHVVRIMIKQSVSLYFIMGQAVRLLSVHTEDLWEQDCGFAEGTCFGSAACVSVCLSEFECVCV